MPTLLIVDDEEDLLASLDWGMRKEGFDTRTATSGAEALRSAALDPRPDLVVLDLMLPDLPGTEVCRRLREHPRTGAIPVLMLTARGAAADRIAGFELGADDYVVKPVSTRELALRVRAILRRAAGSEAGEGNDVGFGLLRMRPSAHRAWVGSTELSLTPTEFRLLHTLLERRGRVQTRERLLVDVWGHSPENTTRTVDTHMKRLRGKLGDAGDYVETVRGVGYRFRERADGG
jgi:two-component system phosphate regulon response regulator PhoB